MKRPNAPLREWRQQGQIAIWRFEPHPSNKFPGWHFSADQAGSESLRDLLGRSPPDAVANRTWIADPIATARAASVVGYRKSGAIAYGRIRISRQLDDDCAYAFAEDGDILHFTIGQSRLSEFFKNIAEERMPQDDYVVSWGRKPDEKLWFWWWLGG